jgi:CBS domain-containing protein
MSVEHIGAIVISEDGQTVAGILSERDIVRGLARHGTSIFELNAKDLMLPATVTCSSSDKLREVVARMTQTRVRHVPVIERGRLCGIISIGDVVKNRLEEVELESEVLRDVYRGTH